MVEHGAVAAGSREGSKAVPFYLGPALRRPLGVIGVWLLLALLAAPGLRNLRVDNSAEGFFVESSPRLEEYRRAVELARSPARGLRMVVSGPDLWTPEGLAWLARFETEAPRVPGVVSAAGLYGRHRRASADAPVADWPPDVEAFRRQVRADPLDSRAGWIDAGGHVGTVLVAMLDDTPERRRRALDGLRRLADTSPPGVVAELAGLPVVNQALDDEIVSMMRRLLPLLAALSVVCLMLAYRQAFAVPARLALVPLIYVTLGLTTTLGLAGHLRLRIDAVTVLVVPLLFVIALATAVHVHLSFLRRRGACCRSDAVVSTYREKAWPVLWTGVTTAAGFGSLTVSPVPPIRSLGGWSVVGLVVITVSAFTLLPALLARSAAGPSVVPERRATAEWGRSLARFAIRRRRVVIVVFLAGVAAVASGLPRLRVDTRLVSYFGPDHAIRRAEARLERAGLGSGYADLWLLRPDAGSFGEPGELDRLAELSAVVRMQSGVRGAVGPGDVASWIDAGSGRSLTFFQRQAAFGLLPPPGRAARVSVSVSLSRTQDLLDTFAQIENLAADRFPGVETFVTGPLPMVLEAQRSLFGTLWRSLAITSTIIGVVLGCILRDGRSLAIALAVNAWPVLAVLGLMGWTAVPLDSSTVMIAAVVLGLSVDDTLHVFGRLRRDGGAGTDSPVTDALAASAPALALTTALLAAGFGLCGLSTLVPIARFGVLAASALVLALAADLLLIPAWLAGPIESDPGLLRGSAASAESPRPGR